MQKINDIVFVTIKIELNLLLSTVPTILDSLQQPEDIKCLNIKELHQLCSELRNFLISSIQKSGGHFAANLGVVELTVALLHVFDFSNSNKDQVIWDVGHQCYGFKVLTGRKEQLENIRHLNGISGFPKRSESIYDAFGTGHSSTSISAMLGMATAAKLDQRHTQKFISVTGDGALTGGMIFEALNNLAISNTNTLVILNDNHIGIDPNLGAIDLHLQNIENHKPNLFENLSLNYSGPIDGHNLEILIAELTRIKTLNSPQILHVRTKKGKGFEAAEKEQTKWHSTNKFVKLNPEIPKNLPQKKWQDVFANTLISAMKQNENIVAITPAMPSGSGMIAASKFFPNRVFDVGIAEQHAATFAAGLATQGKLPVLHLYSTFLQRAYDQLIHDIALQNLHVVLCIDRAGISGEDGPTHHGCFDLAMMKIIPGVCIYTPSNEANFILAFQHAIKTSSFQIIRYPKGTVSPKYNFSHTNISDGIKPVCLPTYSTHAIIAIGICASIASKTIEENNLHCALFDILCVKPLPEKELLQIAKQFQYILIVEDGSLKGGIGESIIASLQPFKLKCKISLLGIKDEFVEHGSIEELMALQGYDATGMKSWFENTNNEIDF